ncbi:hypothetical protein MRB53_002771 [Persea americana]|uniref:Uncharacterized protein n=1 Tax=Persea americana TaxID=3435 RepID=A0ACC2MVT4_PERAE|nr:hypothetical protein MRB53_002771 [Persea americana]
MGVVSDVEGAARRFWIRSHRESVFAAYTPFVVCLASGSLELDTFRHYIAQDVYFLKAFAQAYEMAEECADDDDAKEAIFHLRRDVLEELKLHNSFVEEWGIDFAKETTPNSATVKYTDFLLATAAGKVEGEKGPGKELQPFLGPIETSHRYKKWIDSYSSESFEGSALQNEELLDKLSISLTGEELEVIGKLYHQGMKLEIDFFTAQPIVQRTVVPLSGVLAPAEQRLVLFSDFDLTCTVVDSSAILAEIAIVTAPKGDLDVPGTPHSRKSSADLRNTWNALSRQYTEEYEQCIETIMPTEKAEVFDYEGLCKALEQLPDFEKRANARVIESGVLKGLNIEDIKRAGERLKLQDGCTGFFQKIVNKEELNADVHILSYCWCGDLIRSAFSSGGLNVLKVHSNEFTYNESLSTGEIVKNMESPMDKVRSFKDILNHCSNGKHLSVYIGDSVGDLLCLLEADVGIVVGSSSSLRRVGSQFGVSFVPLFSGLVKKQTEIAQGDSCSWKGLPCIAEVWFCTRLVFGIGSTKTKDPNCG